MASQFQNRLVGAIILISLGIIILPSILDGNKQHYQSEFPSIPLIPKEQQIEGARTEIDLLTGRATQYPSLEAQQNEISQEKPDDVIKTMDDLLEQLGEKDTAPVSGSRTVGQERGQPRLSNSNRAYVIQLGALKNRAKIEAIRSQLQAANYPVYTLPKVPVDGKTTRIFVGPDVSQEKLNKQLVKLKQMTQLDGIVVPYKIKE